MQAELADGNPGPAFAELQRRLATAFAERLCTAKIVCVHNMFTMPFHLAATAALWAWAESRPAAQVVSWIHDLAIVNPDYSFPHADIFPWTLLRQPSAGVRHVAVSERRQTQFRDATGATECEMIPNGMDPFAVLQLTPAVATLLHSADWPSCWPVLFHPTRLLRRKNVELGLAVTAALRDQGERPLYVVTAATDPHHALSREYADSLRRTVQEAGLEQNVVFANDHFAVTDADVAAFARAADALFYPSRQEGFGLPVIESALQRLPVFCPRIEPLTDLGGAHWFESEASAAEIARQILEVLRKDNANCIRRSALARYDWNVIYTRFLAPLLDGAPVG